VALEVLVHLAVQTGLILYFQPSQPLEVVEAALETVPQAVKTAALAAAQDTTQQLSAMETPLL
jgi:hypothetical protein